MSVQIRENIIIKGKEMTLSGDSPSPNAEPSIAEVEAIGSNFCRTSLDIY